MSHDRRYGHILGTICRQQVCFRARQTVLTLSAVWTLVRIRINRKCFRMLPLFSRFCSYVNTTMTIIGQCICLNRSIRTLKSFVFHIRSIMIMEIRIGNREKCLNKTMKKCAGLFRYRWQINERCCFVCVRISIEIRQRICPYKRISRLLLCSTLLNIVYCQMFSKTILMNTRQRLVMIDQC
jgi:hypothetical protein